MASVSSALGKSGQIDELYSPLINGLPDDIALLCLARIPRRYHNILRCVSKRWKALLYSEEWLCCRQKQDLQETWIYAICRHNKRRNCYYVFDPSSARRHWTCLQGVPPQCLKRDGMAFETVGSKLYILGGCTWGEDATDDVYFYDASMNAWAKSTPMPTARCYFATAVLGDRLYATDGAGMDSTLFQSWDTYESHSDHWIPSRAQKVAAGIQKSIALDGKIYTIHEDSNEFHYAGVFDPSDNEWEHLNSEIALCWRGPTVVIDGTLFMLDETSGVKLMRWQRETGDWVRVGRLSTRLVKPPCQLVAVGRTIVVIGKGLSTIFIDVDKSSNVGGMLVSSFSLPELDSDISVLSCKTISI